MKDGHTEGNSDRINKQKSCNKVKHYRPNERQTDEINKIFLL